MFNSFGRVTQPSSEARDLAAKEAPNAEQGREGRSLNLPASTAASSSAQVEDFEMALQGVQGYPLPQIGTHRAAIFYDRDRLGPQHGELPIFGVRNLPSDMPSVPGQPSREKMQQVLVAFPAKEQGYQWINVDACSITIFPRPDSAAEAAVESNPHASLAPRSYAEPPRTQLGPGEAGLMEAFLGGVEADLPPGCVRAFQWDAWDPRDKGETLFLEAGKVRGSDWEAALPEPARALLGQSFGVRLDFPDQPSSVNEPGVRSYPTETEFSKVVGDFEAAAGFWGV